MQDFSPVFAELGETPGNAFLQLVLVPLSNSPALWHVNSFPEGWYDLLNLLTVQALPLDQIISSEDTKLHLPQNLSLRRTATSN